MSKGIRVRNTGGDFTPAPEGLHYAVCCDVVELGLMETPWGKKRKIDLMFQIDSVMENGKPFLVGKRYGATLHPKSTLRVDLESWRGKRLLDSETEDFDLEILLNKCCQVNIVHNKTETGTYANISAIVPPPRGIAPLKVRDYIRVCERAGYEDPHARIDEPGSHDGPPVDITSEEVPF